MEHIFKRRLLIVTIVLVFVFLFSLAGCSSTKQGKKSVENKPVKVKELVEESYSCSLEYSGKLDAMQIKKYSFKMPGKIEKIYVKEGDKVTKADALAALEERDFVLALNAAENILAKAQESYNYTQDEYNKMQDLIEAGAISKREGDKVRLTLDLLAKDLANAKIDYENKRKIWEEVLIKSDLEGFVVGVLMQEGEITASGYPVIVVGSKEKIVRVGVVSAELERVKENIPVKIIFQGEEVKGTVYKISRFPDQLTGAYPVEIALPDTSWPLGAVVKVLFDTGKDKGIFIPLNCVMRGQEDFVYVVNEDQVEKRILVLDEIRDTQVKVQGLEVGDKLVVAGMRGLSEGDRVTVLP